MIEPEVHRSGARAVKVAFRLSVENRAELQRRAAAEGLSVQVYLERAALGRVNAAERLPGPERYTSQEGLPLTA